MKPKFSQNSIRHNQLGSILLEGLISILIFSFGLLGLIGIQANAIGWSIDAKYRADAAYLSSQIVSTMWLDRANIDSYAHHPTGSACAPTGDASANTKVYNGTSSGSWTYQVSKALPGAAQNLQQIKVTTVGTTRRVEVAVCWKRPQEATWHNHITSTQIYQ
jgi:type IV pilus assembly protein PilV